MSWGYWGIVTGLLALLMVLFVSVSLLYSGSKRDRQAPGGYVDKQAEADGQPSRLAA